MLARWSRAMGQISRPGSTTRILGFINGQDTSVSHNYAKVATVAPVDKDFDDTSITTTVKLDKMFWSKPCSLALAKDSPLRIEEPNYEGIRRFLLKLMLYYSKQSTCIRGANVVYKRVITQVDKPAIYSVFNLEKTFKTTFSLLVLHMWLCLRRLKQEGKEGVEFGQFLYEIYNHDLELRVSKAGVNLLLTKWMKDLEKIFYGNLVAYDDALLSEAGKNSLANVIWRNVFSDDAGSEPSDDAVPVVQGTHPEELEYPDSRQLEFPCLTPLLNVEKLAKQAMARYVRREVTCLSLTDKEAVFSGNFMFTSLDNAQP